MAVRNHQDFAGIAASRRAKARRAKALGSGNGYRARFRTAAGVFVVLDFYASTKALAVDHARHVGTDPRRPMNLEHVATADAKASTFRPGEFREFASRAEAVI